MGIKTTQYNLDMTPIATYNSYAEAANVLGVNESSIRRAVKYGRKVCGKFYYGSDAIEVVPPIKFDNTTPIEIKSVKNSKPRILLLDIETSLLLTQVFQKQIWKARIGHNQVVSDYYMLTWSAKWLGENEVFSDRLTQEEVFNEDDGRIVWSLWELLNEADIVVGHNSDSFDIPNIFTRCVYHNYPPPSVFRQIDTLRIAQKTFGFTHNGLDALAGFFGLEGKISTTIELWKSCIRGEEAALIRMETYNRQDVIVLEKIYYKLRPYAKGLPNINMYFDDGQEHCTTCGSTAIVEIVGKYFYTQAVKYGTMRCTYCGAIFRGKAGIQYINKKTISPIPR